jgi:hypothetical protein
LKVRSVVNLVGKLKYERYHNSDLPDGVDVHRIEATPGTVPHDVEIKDFLKIIDGCIQKDKNGLILVHCTHGVNRAGFFICCYLVERFKIPVHVAISLVAVSRGVAIYDARLLDGLFERYDQKYSDMYIKALYPRHDTDRSKERIYNEAISTRSGGTFKKYSEQFSCTNLEVYKKIIQEYNQQN